jgi:hypothetical protein
VTARDRPATADGSVAVAGGMTGAQRLDLVLRVLMELGIVAALAMWGYSAGGGGGWGVVLAVLAPTVGFGFWGAVDFHQAGSWGERLRLAQELLVSAVAAIAWFVAGQPVLGVALAVLSVVYHLHLYSHGGRLLAH